MDFRVFSRNILENMHARCVREDTKQALKGNLQADGVQSRQTLFVRYCLMHKMHRHTLYPKKSHAKPSGGLCAVLPLCSAVLENYVQELDVLLFCPGISGGVPPLNPPGGVPCPPGCPAGASPGCPPFMLPVPPFAVTSVPPLTVPPSA